MLAKAEAKRLMRTRIAKELRQRARTTDFSKNKVENEYVKLALEQLADEIERPNVAFNSGLPHRSWVSTIQELGFTEVKRHHDGSISCEYINAMNEPLERPLYERLYEANLNFSDWRETEQKIRRGHIRYTVHKISFKPYSLRVKYDQST